MECYKCGNINIPNTIYCSECGTQIRGEKIDYNDTNKKYFVQTIALFVCIVLIILMSIEIVNDLPLLPREYLFNGMLVFTVLVFAILDIRGFLQLFRITFHYRPILLIIFIAPVLALCVNYAANFLNNLAGYKSEDYYISYQNNTSNVYLYGIIFISLMPGFIEEFLFRGILFNHLLRLTSPKSTILVSSILFSFIHFSIFSLLWLFPIGLFLGYLRFRFRTIWYSIFFHVSYNASIYLLEIWLNK